MADNDSINMDTVDAELAINGLARNVENLGAACTARIIRSLTSLMLADTQCGARIRAWPGPLLVDAVPLRIAGGLHYLHLSGLEDSLAAIYSGQVADQEEVDAIVCAVVDRHDQFLLGWFDSPPQTNEAGRSACLMAGLIWLSGVLGPRFEFNEIGASAGINSMMGRFGFDLGGVKAGDMRSAMQIVPRWIGVPPPANAVEIVSACGCDLNPIDLTDGEEARRLKSYVWPDVPIRIARIDTAIAMAGELAPDLMRNDAGEWVERRLSEPQESGVIRVLGHSIVWQYLPSETQARIERAMESAGKRATVERPLAWVKFETDRETFRHEISVRYWPGGEGQAVLGHAHAHGEWVEWSVE